MTDKLISLVIKVCDWVVGKDKRITRSDLDESENVHSHEKWLDKHLD